MVSNGMCSGARSLSDTTVSLSLLSWAVFYYYGCQVSKTYSVSPLKVRRKHYYWWSWYF